MLQRLRIKKRHSSDPQRMAKDIDCIRFFEAYWPNPAQLASGLSQFEHLKRIALDPLYPAPMGGTAPIWDC